MKGKILFSEQQKYRQVWHWLLFSALFITPGIILYGVIQQIVFDKPWGDEPISNTGLLILFLVTFVLMTGVFVLLLMTRLEMMITYEKINVKMFPFHRSFRHYRWEDISEATVRRNVPVREFGGYGIRTGGGFGFKFDFTGIHLARKFNKATAYTISGRDILQLLLKDGKKIMIGTQKANELEAAILKMERMDKKNQFNLM